MRTLIHSQTMTIDGPIRFAEGGTGSRHALSLTGGSTRRKPNHAPKPL
jgi:hypothetical protein